MFALFDPTGDLRITTGNLPHWFQPGVTYFVTFRTADSVPTGVKVRWKRDRREWLDRHRLETAADLHRLPRAQQQEYHARFTHAYHDHLDRGHGACRLRRLEVAGIVGDALRHSDGDRYALDSFVVMPNHVHVLVGLRPDADVVRTCYSWKKFTARAINRVLGLTGRFWQEESFDHLVRSAEQFDRIRAYIAENPRRANLSAGEYLLHQVPSPEMPAL